MLPSVEAPDTVKAEAPAVLMICEPADIDREPTVNVFCKSNLAEFEIVKTAVLLPNPVVFVSTNVPDVMLVPPLYVFAPESLTMPV